MVRNQENLYNWKGNSPTPQQVTWFVPLFLQVYDAYKKHLEKTCEDKKSEDLLAPKTVDDPVDHEKRLS